MFGYLDIKARFFYYIDNNGNLTTAESDAVSFIFNIPFASGVASIEIRNATDHVLASKTVTPSSPEVNVTYPDGGEALTAGINYEISWTGFDLDGDDLAYTLAYSEDGGENWVPLAIDLNQASYFWDTSYLQKGSDYLIKVIATDGVNTGEDVSDSTFTVKVHDTAITNVTPTETIVERGYDLNINVSVTNKVTSLKLST